MSSKFGCAAAASITGSGSAQNLMSIENPSDSTIIIRVRTFQLRGVWTGALAGSSYLYKVGRTTGMPSAGTTLTVTGFDSLNATSVAVVRSAPTATLSDTLWSYQQAPAMSAVGDFQPAIGEPSLMDPTGADFVLRPGEGILGMADANATGWHHSFALTWIEE